jgi:glucosyl-dolichyl phosphate glucuronosyltransferase
MGSAGLAAAVEDAGAAPTVSILIATRNRAAQLAATLASIFTPPSLLERGWEVVVADNGSTDATAELCAHFARSFPDRFHWLAVDRRGKSWALNAGLLQAQGEVVAMMDDDVICCSDYIRQVRTLFSDPKIDAAQGRIYIDWIGGKPRWLDDLSIRMFSLRDFGDEQFDWSDHLSGCNLLVRRHAALAVGGFAGELGPGSVGIGEDSEFSMRLRERVGGRIVYAPGVSVRHQVPVARLSRTLMRRRHFGIGRSYAYYVPLQRSLLRLSLHALKELVRAEFVAQLHRVRGRPDKSLACQCNARRRLGFLLQHALFRAGRRERRLTYLADVQRTSKPER